ncbi:hypothetical protein J8TS2_39940 [Lederbergia ruris]|uniref:GNAT family N-acetyltransferase n=2 Tax=Lederbergia ruris TaxID=217495 RepID=A0ABQ4KP14_9BACI|nr:GNAT family N-acetyltransferase [Lederbergia ruris]GIN59675.1 hypothetical protein J8TS2_39940 [Lederbergia ruris]
MLSDLELMDYHVNVLFKHDDKNRMTVVNEPPYDDAPRIFIGGTQQGNLIRYSSILSKSLLERLERVTSKDSGIQLGKIIGVLSVEQQINNFWVGPAFLFPDLIGKSTQTIQITESNKELLRSHFPDFLDDLEFTQPCFAVVRNGSAVSLCCSARQTSICAEASLHTAKSYRGKGYAVDVSNAWAAEIQKQGRIALYSTSWDNFASQSVARKLHLIKYGTDIHMK